MRKIFILMLLFSINVSLTMAQSDKYIIKKSATTSKTTKNGTTQKKKPSYIQKKTTTNSTESAGLKVLSFFGQNGMSYDQAGAMQQLKGYEWIMTDKHETKTDFFPVEGDYDYYPSHPQYRIRDTYLCDNNGIVKAILFIGDGGSSEWFYLNKFDGDRHRIINLAKDLALKEYKDGAYNANLASDNVKYEIDRLFGLHSNKSRKAWEDVDKAKRYHSRLVYECEKKVQQITHVERIDSMAFKLQYATRSSEPTVAVTLQFSPDGPYKTKYRYTFPGMIDVAKEMEKHAETSTNNEQSESDKIFDVVEVPPSYPNGMAALQTYIRSNLKYPAAAKQEGISGRVIVEFVVEKDGTISNVKIARSLDPSLDQEAIRLVKSMPKWIPGKSKGEPVNAKYSIPITFRPQ